MVYKWRSDGHQRRVSILLAFFPQRNVHAVHGKRALRCWSQLDADWLKRNPPSQRAAAARALGVLVCERTRFTLKNHFSIQISTRKDVRIFNKSPSLKLVLKSSENHENCE